MAKVTYQGIEYHSNAVLIGELFKQKKITNDDFSKKKWAKDLDVSFTMINATVLKLVEENSDTLEVVGKRGKVSEVTIINKHNEKDMNDIKGKRILVNYAPNIWGLPVTNPPTYVIDPTYKGDIYMYENKNVMGDLIQF